MSEQPSIFDASFDAATTIRRRHLMPAIIKVYLALIFLAGIIMFVFRLYTMVRMYQFYTNFGYAGNYFANNFYLFTARSLFTCIVFTVMAICLWYEWKWAIRFSWGVLIYWLLIMVSDYITGNNYDFSAGIFALLLAPFYAILYQVQRRWEREAVKHKS